MRLIGSSTDITGTQLMREMQVNAATMSVEAEDFVALAAHDLRAPLRHVTAIADMLRDDFVDMGDGKLELIDMLEALGTKAMELISDVLAHAEATSVTSVGVQTRFCFGDLVRELMGLLDPHGDCRCQIEEGQVVGDRTVTQIILRNLIENAIKYAGKSDDLAGLRLHFSLTERDAGFVDIAVVDNGRSFADPAILLLNEGKLRSGSGFGLFGAHRLVQSRGGTMSAENAANGARVGFCLPGSLVATPAHQHSLRAV